MSFEEMKEKFGLDKYDFFIIIILLCPSNRLLGNQEDSCHGCHG